MACLVITHNNVEILFGLQLHDHALLMHDPGPVFIEEESFPIFAEDGVIRFEWKLHNNSIEVRRYRALLYEVGLNTREQTFPIDFDPPASSQQFLGLTVGTEYVFSVIARGENDGLSEELKLTWEAGKSHCKSDNQVPLMDVC